MNKILVACYTEIINEKVYEDTGNMAKMGGATGYHCFSRL